MKYARALVFDLDDTLMDTYGQLVMDAHRQACLAMHQAGLDVPVEELMATRLRLISAAPREEVNALLARHYSCAEQKVVQAGIDTYFNPEITEIEPFPGVYEMLDQLSADHELFLVTAGFERTQAKKIQVLGIGAYFREICYVPVDQLDGKYAAFCYLQRKYSYAFADMVIVGDRITNEIAAGNRLGCPTIWIRHGECAHIAPAGPHEEPTLSAEAIHALPALLQQLPSKAPLTQATAADLS